MPSAIKPQHDAAPPSFAQERLWFLDRLHPDSALYNIPIAFRLTGTLDPRALERALGEVVRRHDALRTIFPAVDGAPVQEVAPFADFSLPMVDLSPLAVDEREAELQRLIAEEAARPFDLAAGPLFRAHLLRLAEGEHVLLMVMHHIIADGWSLGVLYRELAALYGAYLRDGASPLPEPPMRYAEYARWQRHRLQGAELERQLAYWKERLAGAPALLELPTDHPRPATESHRGASVSAELPGELLDRLRALGRAEGATPFMVLLAAFQLLLGRYAGTDDVSVGTPIAGRMRVEAEELVGFFANTLVLRARLDGDPTFREMLRRVRAATLGAYDHQEMPFERLVAALGPERSLGHSPLFQVMFSVDADPPPELRLDGLAAAYLPVDRGVARYDVSLLVAKGDRHWAVSAQYRAELFERATVLRMLGHLRRLLEKIAGDPSIRLSALEMVDAEERHLLLEDLNRPARAHPGCIHAEIAAQVARTPDAAAVVCGDVSITYQQLDERANRLAHLLARRGAGPEARVGICLDRSGEMMVALLAVLKAGAAYVPLDPRDPAERLEMMIDGAGVRLIVSQASLAGRLPASARVIAVDADAAEIAGGLADASAVAVDPANAAYVVHTSGSTGRPKGVVVTHANVTGFFAALDAHAGGAEPGTWLAVTRIGFDIHVAELLWTLARGFRVLVQPEMERAEASIAAELRRHAVTHLQCTPSLAAMLVAESGAEALGGLRRLLLGGETLPPELAAAVGAVLPGRLVNLYGPTETTVWSTAHPVDGGAGGVPIGRPLANTRAYVLSDGLRLQPVGVPGELCIAGAGVTRGYLGRPALTAERFVPDPFSPVPGARMYRTGDRARWRTGDAASGAVLEFLGRLDAQVKIRGFRVEQGEIEAALRRHPDVAACAVAARGDAAGEMRLVAWVVGCGDADGLRAHLRRLLPEHMVPGAFVFVERLPLNANGKLDRAALPAPEPARAAPPPAAPRDRMEARVAAAWREVLGRDGIGAHDAFFDLGGTSLLLHRVFIRLREIRGDLRMVDLFRHPTVESLARFLGDAPSAAAIEEPSPSREMGDGAIAVVGMACRFPGARTPAELWRNLAAGVESISFFSEDELLGAGVPAERVRDPAYVRAQGSLADAYAFDAAFFGVTPREAAVMDPQHRVFLDCAWSALEDAGADPARFAGAIGVYAGSGTTGHLARVLASPAAAGAGAQLAVFGNAKDFLTTRVSHRLGLRGPSVAVQTACSTSLVAVHLACRALLDGECDLALAGGVTVAPDQVAGYLHQEGGVTSPDGHCRAFDARAAGTVFGSGAGVVALKRLADALRDGDDIRAVVRGSAINNDGAEKIGFTAPGVEGQARVIAAALAAAGVDASTISYVEAHGTGTPLGDPVEVAALTEVFRASTERTAACALGSVKPNLGHLDTAAGVAGLIKAVLALQHRAIPPTLHFRAPNPETRLDESPFYVNSVLQPWDGGGAPLRAGVSSFGFGGTNAHVVLEEAPAPAPSPAAEGAQLLVLSAKTPAALERMRAELAAHLHENPDLALGDVAHTLQEGRHAHPYRWAAASLDFDQSREALGRAAIPSPAPDRAPPVAFLFPGQGAQYAGMAAALHAREPVFRRELGRCAELLAGPLGMDLRDLLFPAPGARTEADARLRQTRFAQPALFAVEYALAGLWASWGVRPESMLGHSIGEYVAACLAGVFTLEAALALVAARGRLMQELPAGAMLAVPLPEAEVRALADGRLSLAAVNGPSHCVVSGAATDVDDVEALLSGRGVAARRLRTSHAFHSAAVDPVLAAFAAEVRMARPAPPTIPFLSNLTGDWITADEATDPDYWASHLRQTVRFAEGVGRLLGDPARVLLEVGPGETLGTFARSQANGNGRRIVARSLPGAAQPEESDRTALEALGVLWSAGVEPDWAAVRRHEPRRKVPLPTYPFERTEYRVPPQAPLHAPQPASAAHPHPQPDASGPATEIASPPPSRIAGRVAGVFAGLLGREAGALEPACTFLELGADSLLLMQASRAIEGTFGIRIPFRRLLEDLSTLGDLSAHLERELPPEPEPSISTTPTGTAVGDGDGTAELALMEAHAAAMRAHAAAMEAHAAMLRAHPRLLGDAISSPVASLTMPSPAESADAAPEPSGSHGPHRPVLQTLHQDGGFSAGQARYFDEFVRRYTARTRRSKEYAASSRARLADNRASLNFRMATKELLYPIVAERSEGARLWDLDGNEYVDFTMGFGVHLFGHRPAFVMEAVDEQLRRGVHIGPQSDLAGPAAARFAEMTGMERVTFCNTGSEAVMTALRIARAVTGRDRVAIFEGSYHGCFDGVLARRSGDADHPRPVAPGTPAGMIGDLVVLPYGAPEALEYLRASARTLAAVLVEPVQSRDPEHQPREFLRALRNLTREAGAALVFDEMITGFRLGPAGAQGWYGVRADLATYGKIVGGGFPIGIVAGSPALMDAVDGGAWAYGDDSYPAAGQTFFAGTFCKHPVAMAAACAVLRHLGEQGLALYDALNARAERLVDGLRGVLRAELVPMRIVHCASIFHFRPDPAFRFADLLFHHLVERGMYIWEGRACYLSTAHTDEDCDRLVDALRDSIHALRAGGFLPEIDGVAARSGISISFPLTPAQHTIWARAREGGDASRAWNEQIVLGIRGRLDEDVLRAALADVVAHHEALRTVFAATGEAQHVHTSVDVPLVTLEGDGDDGALAASLGEEFDLSAGPLLRLHVHPRGDGQVLQLIVHHLVADGVSLGIIRRDLEIACRARRQGRAPTLAPAMPFSDYAARLAAYAAVDAEREAAWLAGFEGAVPLALPADRGDAGPVPAHGCGAREVRVLDARLAAALKEAARREGCTLFVTLLGGVLVLAHRLSGQDDGVVGISSAVRPFPGAESVVGNCADVLPLRTRAPRTDRPGEYLRDLRGRVLAASEHEHLSYARLAAALPDSPPVPALVFNLEPGWAHLETDGQFAGHTLERVEAPARYTRYDLTIDAVESRGEIHLHCTFDGSRFERRTVAHHLAELERVLEEMAGGSFRG